MQLPVYLPVPHPAVSHPNLLRHLFIENTFVNPVTKPCVLMLLFVHTVCFVQEQDFMLKFATHPSIYPSTHVMVAFLIVWYS